MTIAPPLSECAKETKQRLARAKTRGQKKRSFFLPVSHSLRDATTMATGHTSSPYYYYYVYNYRIDGAELRLHYTQCVVDASGKLVYSPGEICLTKIHNLYYVYPVESDEAYAAFDSVLRNTNFCLETKAVTKCVNGRFANAEQPIAFAYDPRPDRGAAATGARRDWVLVRDLSEHPIGIARQEAIDRSRSELLQHLTLAYESLRAPGEVPPRGAYQICGPAPDLMWTFRHHCAMYGKYEASVFPVWLKTTTTDLEKTCSLDSFLAKTTPLTTCNREGMERAPTWLPSIPRLRVLRISDKGEFKLQAMDLLGEPTGGIDLDCLGDSAAKTYWVEEEEDEEKRRRRTKRESHVIFSAEAQANRRYDIVILRCAGAPYRHCAGPGMRRAFATAADRVMLLRRYIERVLAKDRVAFNMCMAYNMRLVPTDTGTTGGPSPTMRYERGIYQSAVYKARLTGVAWETLMLPADPTTDTIMPLCEGAIGNALYRAGYRILPGMRPRTGETPKLHAGTSELYVNPGLYGDGGLLLDVKSYYPNIVREAQCCYTNPIFWEKRHPVTGAPLTYMDYIRHYDVVVAPMYTRIADSLQGEYRTRTTVQSRQHPIPAMMDMLLRARIDATARFPALATALKLVANAIYGSWAYPGARFPAVPLAAVVGHLGQQWLKELTRAALRCAESRYVVCMSITDSLMLHCAASDANADQFMKHFEDTVARRFKYIRVTREDFTAAFFHTRGCYALLLRASETDTDAGALHHRGFIQQHFPSHLVDCIRRLLLLVLRWRREDNASLSSAIVELFEEYHLLSSAIPSQWSVATALTGKDLHGWRQALTPVLCNITPALAEKTKHMKIVARDALESASLVAGRYAGIVVVRNPGTPAPPDEDDGEEEDDATALPGQAQAHYTIVNDVSMDGMDSHGTRGAAASSSVLRLIPIAVWHKYPGAYRLAWGEWYLKECAIPVLRDKILQHLHPDVYTHIASVIPDDLLRRKSRLAPSRSPLASSDSGACLWTSMMMEIPESDMTPPRVYVTCYQCQEKVRVDPVWRHASSDAIPEDFVKSEVDPEVFSLTNSASIDIVRCGNCRALLSDAPHDKQRLAIEPVDNEDPARQRAEFIHLYTYFNTVHDADAGLSGATGPNLNKEAGIALASRIQASQYNTLQW